MWLATLARTMLAKATKEKPSCTKQKFFKKSSHLGTSSWSSQSVEARSPRKLKSIRHPRWCKALLRTSQLYCIFAMLLTVSKNLFSIFANIFAFVKACIIPIKPGETFSLDYIFVNFYPHLKFDVTANQDTIVSYLCYFNYRQSRALGMPAYLECVHSSNNIILSSRTFQKHYTGLSKTRLFHLQHNSSMTLYLYHLQTFKSSILISLNGKVSSTVVIQMGKLPLVFDRSIQQSQFLFVPQVSFILICLFVSLVVSVISGERRRTTQIPQIVHTFTTTSLMTLYHLKSYTYQHMPCIVAICYIALLTVPM